MIERLGVAAKLDINVHPHWEVERAREREAEIARNRDYA
jgi:hypothetical protein